jgi:hypothetical protein
MTSNGNDCTSHAIASIDDGFVADLPGKLRSLRCVLAGLVVGQRPWEVALAKFVGSRDCDAFKRAYQLVQTQVVERVAPPKQAPIRHRDVGAGSVGRRGTEYESNTG